MDFELSEEHELMRSTAESFARDRIAPLVAEDEAAHRFRPEVVREMGELGFFGAVIDEAYGGTNAGYLASALMTMEVAQVSASWGLPFNMQTMGPGLTIQRWGTEEQKQRYIPKLVTGELLGCFAMTEPDVAGSDPTLIQTKAVEKDDHWLGNGLKWFISGAGGAQFAILIARTEEDPEIPQACNTAFLVDIPSEGWDILRDIETMSGSHNHAEIRITDLKVPKENMLGGRGQGHRLGQYRLGPARLAHCMRWIGQAELALQQGIHRVR